MTGTPQAETPPPQMAPSARPVEQPVGDAATLIMRYIEERAQQDDRAELLALVSELLRQMGELQAELAVLKEAAKRSEELRRKYDRLKAREEELQATIRRLEIGFRRHISERVSADQLALALASQAVEPEQSPGAGEKAPAPADSDGQSAAGSDNEDPKGRRKPGTRKRNEHGRRQGTHVPRVVIEVIPDEVQQDGQANYVRIGEEDSSVFGYRRGGLVEFVVRRVKYVRRDAAQATSSDTKDSGNSTDSDVASDTAANTSDGPADADLASGTAGDAVAAPTLNTDVDSDIASHGSAATIDGAAAADDAVSAPVLPVDSAVEVDPTTDSSAPLANADLATRSGTEIPDPSANPSVQKDSVADGPVSSAQIDPAGGDLIPAQTASENVVPIPLADHRAPTGARGEVVVQLHEMLMVPEDPSFQRSPFVDGAIVWYSPPTNHGWANLDHRPAVLIMPLPERPIERGSADASLIAHVFVHKHDYHTPYYRLEKEFTRLGWSISRTCMARWQYECGEILMRITDAMWQDALRRSWIAMDATGTAIRDKKENRYGHVFVLVAPGDSVLFRYTPKYNSDTMVELFGGYEGTIVADACANHNVLFGPGKGREGGCWSHCRRPLEKAFKKSEGPVPAKGLQMIQSLFRIEEEAALCTPEERLRIRQERSAPIVDSFFEWVEKQLPLAPQDSWTRKGLVYARNQKAALREFLSNGEIPMNNNLSERELRRIVKGRANWLSHGSDEHAKRACAIASLVASCEMHGLDPEIYLQEVLTVAPSYPLKDILDLSPKHWVATRQRLIAEGRLKYLDWAQLFSSRLAFRSQ